MRVPVHGGRIEPDVAERPRHRVPSRDPREAPGLDVESLGHDLGHRHAGRERAVRVLEDDLHVAPERPERPGGEPVERPAEHADRPLRAHEPQDREAERGLAGAGFADHAERLALPHAEADPVHGLHVPDRAAEHDAPDGEPDLERPRLDHDRRVRGDRGGPAARRGREEHARIGVLRAPEDRRDRPLLDDAAGLHHADPVGDAAHDAEVVGDEQHRHAEPRLEVGEEREDLRLHGDVERGRRLVGHEQLRLVRESWCG